MMVSMILLVLASSVLLWGSIDARPQNRGKKIQFSPIKSIVGMSVKFSNKAAPLEGTDEFLDGLRLVMVTKNGYEYTGSLQDVASLFSTKEDKDNELHTRPLGEFRKVLEDSLEDLAEKRSVIGNDQRQLQVPSSFPYTAIGRIAIGCTGTFVAPKTVLTAAHCVYNVDDSSWYSNLDVSRAKDCNPDEGTKHTWTNAITVKAWIDRPRPDNDIAWIIVNSNSPVTMSITALTPPDTSTTVYIYGYPDDLPNQCLYGTSCPLSQVLNQRLRYTCDTSNGNSGSPIYYDRSGVYTIIGVHAYGASQGMNSGTRITSSYYAITRVVITNNGNIV